MAIALSDELKAIIGDSSTVAVISAVGKNGNPYSQVPHKISVREDGRIAVHQLLEKSQLQKNLVYSLWFSKKVSLVIVAKDGRKFHLYLTPYQALVAGREFTKDGRKFHLYLTPYQALVAGREFTKEYESVLAEFGEDADLSTVWLFDVDSYASATYKDEHAQEKAEHPYLYHMDHIVKEEFRA